MDCLWMAIALLHIVMLPFIIYFIFCISGTKKFFILLNLVLFLMLISIRIDSFFLYFNAPLIYIFNKPIISNIVFILILLMTVFIIFMNKQAILSRIIESVALKIILSLVIIATVYVFYKFPFTVCIDRPSIDSSIEGRYTSLKSSIDNNNLIEAKNHLIFFNWNGKVDYKDVIELSATYLSLKIKHDRQQEFIKAQRDKQRQLQIVQKKKKVKKRIEKYGARGMVQACVMTYLQRVAHDPDSLEFVNFSNPYLIEGVGYEITCTFRAKNMLGATIQQSKNFVVKKCVVISESGGY